MKLRCLVLLLAGWLTGCGTGAGSGFLFDGGQSGTGISTIRGNVASTPNMDLSGVVVTLQEHGAATTTDLTGAFLIEGEISGAARVSFELASEDASAEANVIVPSGGTVQLLDVVLTRNTPQIIEEYEIEFEGVIEAIDCAGDTLSIDCREGCDGLLFTVNLVGSEVRDQQGQPIACEALTVGTFVEIEATADDQGNLVAASVAVEDEESEGESGGEGPGKSEAAEAEADEEEADEEEADEDEADEDEADEDEADED